MPGASFIVTKKKKEGRKLSKRKDEKEWKAEDLKTEGGPVLDLVLAAVQLYTNRCTLSLHLLISKICLIIAAL